MSTPVTCATCGGPSGRKFCSRPCYYASLRGKGVTPLADRFWAEVEKTVACWNWRGSRVAGYGTLKGEGDRKIAKTIKAHRLSWELHYGPIPSGMLVCHHCDNRACVRPDHLFLGKDADNSDDKVMKGRQGHPAQKLTANKVREIRRRVSAGERQTPLAVEFGISTATLSCIVSRK